MRSSARLSASRWRIPPLSVRLVLLFAGRTLLCALGLWFFSLGVVMTLRSGLGLSPWDSFHQGLSRHLPITLGQATIGTSIAIVLLSLLLGIRPGLGTLMNAILIGIFVDGINGSGVLPDASDQDLVVRLLLDAGGVLVIGLGTALYLKPRLGAGPRDSLMLAVRDRFHLRIGMARACIELSVVVCGWLLGGTVGVGTLIFALGVGPAVELFFRVFRVQSKRPAAEIEPA